MGVCRWHVPRRAAELNSLARRGQENANASGVRTSGRARARDKGPGTNQPAQVIAHRPIRLTRRWENETKFPSFRGLAPLYGVFAANVPRAWRNAVNTVYLSNDLTRHPAVRAGSLPAATARARKKISQVLIGPIEKSSFRNNDDFYTMCWSGSLPRPKGDHRSRLYKFCCKRDHRSQLYPGGLGRGGYGGEA